MGGGLGVVGISNFVGGVTFGLLQNATNDAGAATLSVPVRGLYRNGSQLMIRVA